MKKTKQKRATWLDAFLIVNSIALALLIIYGIFFDPNYAMKSLFYWIMGLVVGLVLVRMRCNHE